MPVAIRTAKWPSSLPPCRLPKPSSTTAIGCHTDKVKEFWKVGQSLECLSSLPIKKSCSSVIRRIVVVCRWNAAWPRISLELHCAKKQVSFTDSESPPPPTTAPAALKLRRTLTERCISHSKHQHKRHLQRAASLYHHQEGSCQYVVFNAVWLIFFARQSRKALCSLSSKQTSREITGQKLRLSHPIKRQLSARMH